MRRLLLSVCILLAGVTLGAQDWGGHYTMEIPEQGTGDLYLVPVSPSEAHFLLCVKNADGKQMVYESTDAPVPLRDGKFTWRYPEEGFSYTLTLDLYPEIDGVPMEGAIGITGDTGGSAAPFDIGISPDGYYHRDENVFVTPECYMYRIGEGGVCTLTTGGIYTGTVSLPQSVKGPFGRIFRVAGVDSGAFLFSRGLTRVQTYDDGQHIAPGALMYTDIPYEWGESPLPFFAYPNKAKDRFVIPNHYGLQCPESKFQWVIFKQNLAPAMLSGNTTADENKREGRADMDFDSTRGVFYTLQTDKTEIGKLFRGYTAMEMEALVADPMYVAHHTFPSFGRWKFPEKEVSAPKFIETAMKKRTGRDVMYSRKAAWLRDGSGELDIVEYQHVNHQAMVSFVWHVKGDIKAVASITTDIESEYEDYSVWNVDDDGRYGIPDVVTIAQDKDGAVTVFLAKNAPESITCFALHQQGSAFQLVQFDQWYRFVD